MGNVCVAKPCCLQGNDCCGQCGSEFIAGGNAVADPHVAKLMEGPKPTKSAVLRMNDMELANAEAWAHQHAYAMFDEMMNHSVPWDSEMVQSYVLEHTALQEGLVGEELMRAAAGRPFLEPLAFSSVMSRHCIGLNECAGRWARISKSRWEVDAEDCRKGLQDFLRESLNLKETEVSAADEVLDIVMCATGVTVTFPEWEALMTRTARLMRLLKQLPLL
mmetsp:Transcript_18605/g.43346  ORF Transcript_18605/g.43346 Transcript_18605/m.43346 type:complete len:219 (+) Transcript_18605:28-684(+)